MKYVAEMKAILLAAILPVFAIAGCSTVERSPAFTQTDITLASQAHWIAQPATATVAHDDYDELWEAAIGAARWHGFRPDRLDYRNGLLITFPITSKQVFEIWKRDTATIADLTESTLATVRRTIRFEIAKQPDGGFECVPKVIVERFSEVERRITSVTQYRESFSIMDNQGSRERDKGLDIPVAYWYTTGRDAALEKELAQGIQSRVRGMVARR